MQPLSPHRMGATFFVVLSGGAAVTGTLAARGNPWCAARCRRADGLLLPPLPAAAGQQGCWAKRHYHASGVACLS